MKRRTQQETLPDVVESDAFSIRRSGVVVLHLIVPTISFFPRPTASHPPVYNRPNWRRLHVRKERFFWGLFAAGDQGYSACNSARIRRPHDWLRLLGKSVSIVRQECSSILPRHSTIYCRVRFKRCTVRRNEWWLTHLHLFSVLCALNGVTYRSFCCDFRHILKLMTMLTVKESKSCLCLTWKAIVSKAICFEKRSVNWEGSLTRHRDLGGKQRSNVLQKVQTRRDKFRIAWFFIFYTIYTLFSRYKLACHFHIQCFELSVSSCTKFVYIQNEMILLNLLMPY